MEQQGSRFLDFFCILCISILRFLWKLSKRYDIYIYLWYPRISKYTFDVNKSLVTWWNWWNSDLDIYMLHLSCFGGIPSLKTWPFLGLFGLTNFPGASTKQPWPEACCGSLPQWQGVRSFLCDSGGVLNLVSCKPCYLPKGLFNPPWWHKNWWGECC